MQDDQETPVVPTSEHQGQNINDQINLRLSLLSMSKEVLERNAALKWEQDKTKGLEVSAEEIIKEAGKLLRFVLDS